MPLAPIAWIDHRNWPCHGWEGWLHGIRDEGEATARLGETGSVGQVTRARAPESSIVITRVCSTPQDATNAAEQAEAYAWRVLGMTDNWGRIFPRVRIHSITTEVLACRGNGPDGRIAAAKVVATIRCEVLPDA